MKIADILAINLNCSADGFTATKEGLDFIDGLILSNNEATSKLRSIVELLPEIKDALAACMVDSLSNRERTYYFNISEKLDKWENE